MTSGSRTYAEAGIIRLALAAGLLLQSPGCTVGPDFSTPPAPVWKKWLESNNSSVETAAPVSLTSSEHREDWDWWTAFHDPTLDRLIQIAYQQNLSLESAGTRVLEARAQLGVAIGEFYPQLQQTKGSLIYARSSHADPTATPASQLSNFWRDSLGLSANWE